MTTARRHLAVCLLAMGAVMSARSQNRSLIVVDPAHGGTDQGATFNGAQEKDLTLALAATLRTLLVPRNFSVDATRDTDVAVTPDQRASIANHLRPAACLILHASATGNGIHIVTSNLPPMNGPAPYPLAWDTAQSILLPQSRALANILGLAILRAKLPVTLTAAALRPLDNLTCPAVAIEIAPLANGSHATPPTDPAYQRRLAEAVAAALTDWRNTQPAGSTSSGAAQ